MTDDEYMLICNLRALNFAQDALGKVIFKDDDPARKDFVKAYVLVQKLIEKLGRRIKIDE